MNPIHLFCGHYGSGKTEVAIDDAIRLRRDYNRVIIVDLDIVNPYFRTVDAREKLTALGIEVLSSEFAGSNVDIPSLPPDILKVFCDPDAAVVFDVGGDDDGAIALGQYFPYFKEHPYAMYLVANVYRPLTGTADELMEMLTRIQAVSRLQFTGLINNANLAQLTTAQHVLHGQTVLRGVTEKTGLPVSYTCVDESIADTLPAEITGEIRPIHRHLKLQF